MLKVFPSTALRVRLATERLIETLGWYKEQPKIDLLAVHLPVPRFPNMGIVVSDEMRALLS